MRPYKVKVAVGGSESLAAVGDFVRLSSLATDMVIVETDNGDVCELWPGDYVELNKFDGLRVRHLAAVELDITLYVGNGTRSGSSRVAGDVTIIDKKATTITDPAVINLTNPGLQPPVLVVAANAARRGLRFRNAVGSTGGFNTKVALGGANMLTGGNSYAVELANTGSLWNETECPTAAWYAKITGTSATDVDLHIQEIF